jgi:phosphohistidine phosphatase SixA
MPVSIQPWFAAVAAGLLALGSTSAARGADAQPIENLQRGGYVLLMRHASSPREAPTAAAANPDNRAPERQLDASGREQSRAMGDALRALRIPIGDVLSSPTYRALETVRYAALGEPLTAPELGDGGRSMQPDAVESKAAWLRSKLAESPRAGTNTVLVTHQPNIVSALGREWSDVADGEMLIVDPGKDRRVIGRVRMEEWETLMRR